MASTKSSVHSAITNRSMKSTTTAPANKVDLLERFRDPKVCDMPATSPEPKLDAFEEFRPKPHTVLGYNISQTDIKGQRKEPTGITKLHIQQTTAQYELPPPGYVFEEEIPTPPPPPEPKFQYSTGRGPVSEFLEDKWRRKVEKKQKARQGQLGRLIAARKKLDREKKSGAHAKLIKSVGPDWFQELSPKQLKTVDSLKNCIVKDVKNKTTCNTEANIAELGVVLRPIPRHIKIALKKCCECPVEFLLILYQLMNCHRTKYSLNDRLLLSGVVHLTMRETLKELHIRIPSPPPLKKPKTPEKKEKRKNYKSPYLVPFTFIPTPRKHTGIYKNNHIQYPDSPYFSYISELKSGIPEDSIEEMQKESKEETQKDGEKKDKAEKDTKILITKRQSGITDEQEKKLITELRIAQREYNKLVDYEPVPFLRKPSIYIPCDHGLKKKIKEEVEEEEHSSENETNTTISVSVRVTTDFDEFCQPIRKVCECKITFDETKVPKHSEVESISISSLADEWENEGEDEEESERKMEYLQSVDAGGSEPLEIFDKTKVPVKTTAVSTSELGKDFTSTSATGKVSKAEDLEKQKELELVASLKSDQLEPVNMNENLVNLSERESSECKCKEEVERIIETNLCQCDRCKADRAMAKKKKKPTYIISGVQEARLQENVEGEYEDTQVISIISGTKAKKTCDCLQKYRAKVKMYEEMKKRFDTQHSLKTLQQQYIIGGVTYSPTGEPVYMLSGVVPKRECPCAKIYQEQLNEARRLANMPKIPLGRQKYIISGVRETEHGNVYIVSGAAATEDCSCLKIYKTYERKHAPCLKMYEDYLQKIELDTKEYIEELVQDSRFGDGVTIQLFSKGEDEISAEGIPLEDYEFIGENEQQSENINAESQEVSRIVSGDFTADGKAETYSENLQPESAQYQRQPIAEKEPSEVKEVCQCGVIDDVPDQPDEIKIDTDLNLTLEIGKKNKNKKGKDKKNKKVCICEPDYTVCICQKIDPSVCECGKRSSSSESEESEEILLKRFIILDIIPCQPSKQLEILKQALEVLAEDGFPLAKLPDSYKLPHFKLWMQLRCGKFWRQEDRIPMLMNSYAHWRHYMCCGQKVKIPEMDIPLAQAHKYTWAHAKNVKQIAMEKDIFYYRNLRQANVGDGREYFPSTFSYELPTTAFRDCYFAYAASKEEDCICWRPWYAHEIKDFKTRKSCL